MLLAGAATVALLYILYSAIPAEAARLEDQGAALPASTILALAASNWFVRLLPFLILLSIPLACVVIVAMALAFRRSTIDRLVEVMTRGVLLVAAGILALCAFLLYAIHAA